MTALTIRERKKEKEISTSKYDREREKEKTSDDEEKEKIESKKVQRLKDLPSATDLTSSTMMMRRQRSRSDMPRVRLSSLVSIQKK